MGGGLVLPALIMALLALLYLPAFIWLGSSWLHNPYYGHGFLIPLISGFLAWRYRNRLRRLRADPRGAALLATGLSLYPLGFVLSMPFLRGLSLLITLTGLSLYFFSTTSRHLMFPIWLLIFTMPLPYLSDVAYWMQHIAARGSTAVVQILGVSVSITGAEVRLDSSSFTIGIPCSGMSTLISLMAVVAVWSYVLSGPVSRKGALCLLALPIAILANILRISLLLWMADHFGAEATMGILHGLSSLLLFLVALSLLLLISRLLGLDFSFARTKKR